MTDTECAEILGALKAAYPRQDITRETVELYTVCLSDLPAAAVRAAVTRHILTSPWFPTVADLRRLVAEAVRSLPTPEEAWAEVRAVAAHPTRRRIMIYDRTAGGERWRRQVEVEDWEHPQFSCPEIQAAVNAVGWDELRFNDLSDNPGVARGQFMRIYAAIRARAMEGAQTGEALLPPADGHRRGGVEQLGSVLARLLPAPGGGPAGKDEDAGA